MNLLRERQKREKKQFRKRLKKAVLSNNINEVAELRALYPKWFLETVKQAKEREMNTQPSQVRIEVGTS